MQDVLEISCAKIVAEIERRLDDLQSWEPGPELDRELEKAQSELKTWTATWARLSNCQSEWIGYKATCCKSSLAIPIGCNHRGCFLCNSARLRKYRERVKALFGRLTRPVFLTLTVPNTKKISKRTFSALRRGWNQFRKNSPWIEGGIYAIETTFNKSREAEGPWHTHIHALASADAPIPQCRCGFCNRCGKWLSEKSVCRCGGHAAWRWHRYDDTGEWAKCHKTDCAFIGFKRRIEFDWFLATGGRKQRWSSASFHQWANQCEPGFWKSQLDRKQWDSRNRRVVHIKRVSDREKACLEVVKYVTKVSDFADNHRAVKEFFTASRGARMLQTFGTWYGLKLDPDVNKGMPSAENAWNGLQCDCGKNQFERWGRVYAEAICYDKDGRARLKKSVYERGSPPGFLESSKNSIQGACQHDTTDNGRAGSERLF
ncbi:MAG TPA: hypothetical protein VFB79_21420 [Candidatus Angelobacter sp.]|nr:hypothetical protein [Candidatus Angelobacter sp.]